MWLPREFECLRHSQCAASSRIEEALEGADVVIVLRVQQERLHEPALPLDEYILLYQLTPERLALARAGRPGAASRSDDSRTGDRSGRGRWPAVLRAGAGYQRPGRAHGAALLHDWRPAIAKPTMPKGSTHAAD